MWEFCDTDSPGLERAPVSNRWSLLDGVHKLGCLERWAHHGQRTQVTRITISSTEKPSDRTVMGSTLGPECTSFPIPPNQSRCTAPRAGICSSGFFWGEGGSCNCFHWAVNKAREMLCIQAFPHAGDRESKSLPPAFKQNVSS